MLCCWNSQITVGAQSITHAQSIARRHTTYVIMPKKPTFREFFLGKIQKQEFARRILGKKSVFLPLKLLNKHFSKMTFFSLIQMLPVVYCGCGKFSPTVKPNSGSCLKSQPMFRFPWGVMGKIFWGNSLWSWDFATTYAQQRTKYSARIKYSACW